MMCFIDDHRALYAVEPICKVLPIAPSTYYTHAARRADPEPRPERAILDDALCSEIRRVFEDNKQVHNALADTNNGLYEVELINRRSWKNLEAVGLATLDWVDWFNHKRLLGRIRHVPPAEAEENYYRQQAALLAAA